MQSRRSVGREVVMATGCDLLASCAAYPQRGAKGWASRPSTIGESRTQRISAAKARRSPTTTLAPHRHRDVATQCLDKLVLPSGAATLADACNLRSSERRGPCRSATVLLAFRTRPSPVSCRLAPGKGGSFAGARRVARPASSANLAAGSRTRRCSGNLRGHGQGVKVVDHAWTRTRPRVGCGASCFASGICPAQRPWPGDLRAGPAGSCPSVTGRAALARPRARPRRHDGGTPCTCPTASRPPRFHAG